MKISLIVASIFYFSAVYGPIELCFRYDDPIGQSFRNRHPASAPGRKCHLHRLDGKTKKSESTRIESGEKGCRRGGGGARGVRER